MCPVGEALSAHLEIAYALAPVWLTGTSAVLKNVVSSQLHIWSDEDDGDEISGSAHLELLKTNLINSAGKDAAVVKAALKDVEISDRPFLNEMFDAVKERVLPLYEKSLDTPVAFEILPVRGQPYKCRPPRDFGAIAKTMHHNGTPVIQLSVCPSYLGPRTLASIPYILCHEFVSHVFQNAEANLTDPFAEGWMDYVALSLHDTWAHDLFSRDPSLAKNSATRLSMEVRETETEERLDPPNPASRRARTHGWIAAEVVSQWFRDYERKSAKTQQHSASDGYGRISLFERLSIEINVVDLPVDQRRKFVSAVRATSNDPIGKFLLESRLLEWISGTRSVNAVIDFTGL